MTNRATSPTDHVLLLSLERANTSLQAKYDLAIQSLVERLFPSPSKSQIQTFCLALSDNTITAFLDEQYEALDKLEHELRALRQTNHYQNRQMLLDSQHPNNLKREKRRLGDLYDTFNTDLKTYTDSKAFMFVVSDMGRNRSLMDWIIDFFTGYFLKLKEQKKICLSTIGAFEHAYNKYTDLKKRAPGIKTQIDDNQTQTDAIQAAIDHEQQLLHAIEFYDITVSVNLIAKLAHSNAVKALEIPFEGSASIQLELYKVHVIQSQLSLIGDIEAQIRQHPGASIPITEAQIDTLTYFDDYLHFISEQQDHGQSPLVIFLGISDATTRINQWLIPRCAADEVIA